MLNRKYLALSAALVLFAATLHAVTPVSITSTNVNSSNVLTVNGSGFATGATPTFIFNGHTLTVRSFSNTSVTATLPSGTSQGNYQVTIRNSQGQSATVSTTYDVDAADIDPALVTDGTLTGNGTRALPLGIALPAHLSKQQGGPILWIENLSTNNAHFSDAIWGYGGAGGAGIMGQGGPFDGNLTGNGGSFYGGRDNGLPDGGGVGVWATGGFAGGTAVVAYGSGGTGSCAGCGEGVYAQGGNNSDGTVAIAGDFNGPVTVTGNLSKSGGSFQIDHPLDPANKYLSHSFVESPDMMNIYNGNIVTDGTGNATVTLPDWFEALNRDFRYQLTVIGVFAQATVAQEVTHNQFLIRTDKPSVKVSWQITGIRHDAWADAHRIPVEEEKPEKERGFYKHPELFNQPPEKSREWARHPEMMKKHAELMKKAAQHAAQ